MHYYSIRIKHYEEVGAVWTKIMDDYGYVDDDTSSFAISLYREHRGSVPDAITNLLKP